MRRELKQSHAALRRAEYERRGLDIETLIIALIEGDEAELARIRRLRAEVKTLLPKAEGKDR